MGWDDGGDGWLEWRGEEALEAAGGEVMEWRNDVCCI